MSPVIGREEISLKEIAMSATMTSTKRNGIDLAALQGAIEAIRANPAAGLTQFAVDSRWAGGTRSDHAVEGCRIGGQTIDRRFTLRVDEPLELCGTNQYANPYEYLMSAINASMIVGFAAVAALMGVKLTKLQIRTSGDIDLRGALGIDANVTPGYESLQQTVTIAGDATPEQFRQLHETVKKISPNYFSITNAIAMQSRLVVE
jgi:uncharacterized OsmC-like protein